MFEPLSTPRVFGVPPGVDFPRALYDGLKARVADAPPTTLAHANIIVNTTRMQRRIMHLFHEGSPAILPRLHLLTQLGALEPGISVPPAMSPLRRRLELISLVSQLIDAQPDLAPRASLYDLTDSLAALMDEMQGEGVSSDTIEKLDVSDASGHWQRAQAFIRIAQEFLAQTGTEPDKEARQRQLVIALASHWETNPPQHPVILAGSTGSRGTTLLLMEAIARLPQGAIVLPGFDMEMPRSAWSHLNDAMLSEDHPQYRFHKLLRSLQVTRGDVQLWHDTPPPSVARNALVSLSLRPAPVTDAWLAEGPKLRDLDQATQDITLLQAPSPRTEALAIALRLRKAAQDGQKAAVISPDRILTRQITAALDQWDIIPDDSAGMPLHLSPPGRFLRHTAALLHRRLDAESLLTLLNHPLAHSASDRGPHVFNTQRLEIAIRAQGLPYPDASGVAALMNNQTKSPEDQAGIDRWSAWVGAAFCAVDTVASRSLEDWVEAHIALSETISRGVDGEDTGELWEKKAGQEALAVMEGLRAQASYGGQMSGRDYADLVGALLAEGEVRDRDAPHPDIMIWGTLEARVQGADLVILAGLNDGTWPEAPAPDPWLNRAMRHKAGLLLPERRIGLSAHDYQQAVAAPEVWITRSIRSDDAETVASRWLNRLQNLLGGLHTLDGPDLLAQMIARGDMWLDRVATFEAVDERPPAKRPSPRPPASARPTRLSVTEIKRLIRDPYAVYAKRTLGLQKLGPLVQTPDALLRGTVLHVVMERFIKETAKDPERLTVERLLAVTDDVLAHEVPWPAARQLWAARLSRIAEWFVTQEQGRRRLATPYVFEKEARGLLKWPELNFELSAEADRIDKTETGEVLIYDYKTGDPPSDKQQSKFDKQLLIEAAMVEEGAFHNVAPARVIDAVFIGLGTKQKEVAAPIDTEPTAKVLGELRALIEAYKSKEQGFTARRMMEKDAFGSDYDLLSRFGEWDETDDPVPEDLK